MFNNYKDQSGYYSRHPTYQDDVNQPPLVPKEASKQTSAPPWDLSQTHPSYNYCTDQHLGLPVRMPALMQRQAVGLSYDNTPPLYRSYNNSNNQHVLRPKALITCQSNCNRVGCCKDVPRVPQHWNLATDKSNGNVPRTTICKGVGGGLGPSQPVSQHTSSVESGSRVTGNIDCGVKEFPRFHRDIAGSDHSGISVSQFKNDLTSQQDTSLSKQLTVTNSDNASNPKKDTSFLCQRSCAPNCQQYDHQAVSKFSLSGQTQLTMAAPPVSNQWLCDSQTRMWNLQTKQPQCVMPLEGVDMTLNNPVTSNYWLERAQEKPSGAVPTSKSSYQEMFEYQIQQEQHQKYAQHYQDPDRLKITLERVRYQESLRSSQPDPSGWTQEMPRRMNLPPYPVPRYANANVGPRLDHDTLTANASLPPSYPYATHNKVPLNYTDPTQYPPRFNSTYTQAQSKISKSNTGFNPHVHSTHATNIDSSNCIRPTIIQHQPPHYTTNVEVNTVQTGKSMQYISSGPPYNNQPYNSCNEVYNNVNYSKTMQVVDKPCLNTPRIIQPYTMYDKNLDPFYKSIFGRNTGPLPVTRNLMYEKNNMPPRQVIYNQSYNSGNLQSTATHQPLGNNMGAFHTTGRPIQENVGMLGSHAVQPQNALLSQPPTAISLVETDAFTPDDSNDRPIKKRKPHLIGFEKPLGMDLRQFIETWEEEQEDVPYQTLTDMDTNKDFRGVNDIAEEGNVDSSVIKLYPADSDEIHTGTGTSVIKPLNVGQQLPGQQHISRLALTSEKLDLQEHNLPIKINENVDDTHSPSRILQNLLSSSEDVTSPVGALISDELNSRPILKDEPASEEMTSVGLPQLSCGYEQNMPSTDDGNLDHSLHSTKFSKSILERPNNGGEQSLHPNVKQYMHDQLKENHSSKPPTPLAEIINSGDKYIDSDNLKSEPGENLNQKQELSEAIKSNSQSYSSDNENNTKLINVAGFDHKPTLPDKINSWNKPGSPTIVEESAATADDVDAIITSTEKTSEPKPLPECVHVEHRPTSSMEVDKLIDKVASTKRQHKTTDSLQLSQEIRSPCKSSTKITSWSNSQNMEAQNTIETNKIYPVQPEAANIVHKSSRPRPLPRKRKSSQERSIVREATAKDDSGAHITSLPILATENTCILLQKMHTDGVGSRLEDSSNITCKTGEINHPESVLPVDTPVSCLPTTAGNGNSVVDEVSCQPTGLDSDVTSGILPGTFNKPFAVDSTLVAEDVTAQNHSLRVTKIKHMPKTPSEDIQGIVDPSVITLDEPSMENKVESLINEKSYKLPATNLVRAEECHALQITKSTTVFNNSSHQHNPKSNQSCIDGSRQSFPHNLDLNSSNLNIKETLHTLTENKFQHLENVEDEENVPCSPASKDTEVQSVTEDVIEKSVLQEIVTVNTKTECIQPCVPTLLMSQKKSVDFSQSYQKKSKLGVVKECQSEDKLKKHLNNISISNNLNIADPDKINPIKQGTECQSTTHTYTITENEKSNVVEHQRSQSLEKCSNSVIRYISSEVDLPVIDENVIPKHSSADQELPVEICEDVISSCPVQEDIASSTSNKSDKIIEQNVVKGRSRKSKLLSVRIVKKKRNQPRICDSTVESVCEKDKQSGEYLRIQKEDPTIECGSLCGSNPETFDNVNIELNHHGSFNSNKDKPDALSNSRCVDNSKTQTCEDKHLGMTKRSQTLITADVELLVVSPIKLPEKHITQSQSYASSDESNEDILDLDASYEFDMQTEIESQSSGKESPLNSVNTVPGNVFPALSSPKSGNLVSNNKDNAINLSVNPSNNDLNVIGNKLLTYENNAEPNSDVTILASPARSSTSQEVFNNLDASSPYPEFYDGALKEQIDDSSSLPRTDQKKYSKPHLKKANRSKNRGKDKLSTQSSKSVVHIQCSDKNTRPTSNQDGHDTYYKLNKINCRPIDMHTEVETLHADCNKLLKSAASDSVESQPESIKPRCDRVNEPNVTTSDVPELGFMQSDNNINSYPVLNKQSLILDTVNNSVSEMVSYVEKPHDGAYMHEHKQEHGPIHFQNPNFEKMGNCESIDGLNECHMQTKHSGPSYDLASCRAEENLSPVVPVLGDQGFGVGSAELVSVRLQHSEHEEGSMEDCSPEQSNNEDKCYADIDSIVVVSRDGQSLTNDNSCTMVKGKASVDELLVKNKGMVGGLEKEMQSPTFENSSIPINESKHLIEDSLAEPVSRVEVESLDDSDETVDCNKSDGGTLETSECSMKGVLKNISAHNYVEGTIQRDSVLSVDHKVSRPTREENPLAYNSSDTISDNKYNYEAGIISVSYLPLDKDKGSLEDDLSEALPLIKDPEHTMSNSLPVLDGVNDNETRCVEGVNMAIAKGKHSKVYNTEQYSDLALCKDERPVEAFVDQPLARGNEEHLDENMKGNEVSCKGSRSDIQMDQVEHLTKYDIVVPIIQDESCLDVNADKIITDTMFNHDSCGADYLGEPVALLVNEEGVKSDVTKRDSGQCSLSMEDGINQVGHVIEHELDTSVRREEAHLISNNNTNCIRNDNQDSCMSSDFPLITIASNENSAGDCADKQAGYSKETISDEIIKDDEYDSLNGKYLGENVDKVGCLEKETTYELVDAIKEKLEMENATTVVVKNVHCSMGDESVKIVEDMEDIVDDAPLEVHCIGLPSTDKEGEDLPVPSPMSDSSVTLPPIEVGLERSKSTSGEERKVAEEIVELNVESKIAVLPLQEIDTLDTGISSSLTQSHSSFEKSDVECSTSNQEILPENTRGEVSEIDTSHNDSHSIVEAEPHVSCYEDHVTSTQSISQTCFESFQAEENQTTNTNILHEYSAKSECQNRYLHSNSKTSEEKTVKTMAPDEKSCSDTHSNISESPEMPLLEIISDLNSSTDQDAPYETCCDSDTEMPLLEKYSDFPTPYPKDDQLCATNSKCLEGNHDLNSESSGDWNNEAVPEEQCTDGSCIDIIPVGSVSNWPYLEEEVFSEAQITGSPQVGLSPSCLDDVRSEQRLTLSSSDTETEPDRLGEPSTNTALDIVCYKNGKSDLGKETTEDADLKCRLSWKKIFNLAKVEERKKHHKVGEAKNRKEAYRRWPYYGKTGHRRRSLISQSTISNSIDKCDEESNTEMSSNDVDGLVLGPAKIEFRLASKSQTERWQVVDGSKTIELCGGEENNNLADRAVSTTLKTQAPIVLVKQIILKRRRDGNHNTNNNISQNYPCSTSMINPPSTCSNRPIARATLAIPSSYRLHEVNGESEFSYLTTPPESDDSSTSLKTLERLPKVIIKRTGYGNAKYKSYLRLSVTGGSRWQPFVRLERKKYLDNLAKQLIPQSDFIDEDIGKSTPQPITFSLTNQLQEVNEGPSTIHTDQVDGLTLPEIALAKSVDVNQENVPKKLCTGTYTTIKKHSKDTKLTFQLSNTNKKRTEECDSDENVKQGIVNNKLIKTNEVEECQVRVLKTVKHSARRCSEGGTSQVKKKLVSKYRDRIGSEGANSGVMKPKKRSLDDSNRGVVWHKRVNKSKFPKTNLISKETLLLSDEEYNGTPENPTTKEQKGKKSLKQKFKVIPCQACNYSSQDEAEQSAHIIQHPFHCQKCTVAFKSEDDFKSHLSSKHPLTKELHHCLLCKLSFPSAKQHQQHLSDRQHRHLDLTQRWTIQTLFKMFTGEGCSRITPLTDYEVAEMSQLTDAEPGAINYYHQATPLQLAVQDLLKQTGKFPLATVPVSSARTDQDTSDAGTFIE